MLLRCQYVILIAVGLLGFFSCKKQTAQLLTDDSELFKKYISGYSAGMLERDMPFIIEFIQPHPDSTIVGKSWNSDVPIIEPALPGNFVWENPVRLAFYPERSKINSKQEYQITLDLKTIYPDFPQAVSQVQFKFRFQPVQFNFEWGIPRPDQTNDSEMYISMQVLSNEDMDPKKLAESFSVKDVDNHHIKIEANAPEMKGGPYQVLISGIPRLKDAYTLHLSWKDPTGMSEKSNSKDFEIPSIADFKVMGVQKIRTSAKLLRIFFSDKLDRSQDVSGALRIDNFNGALNSTKDIDYIDLNLEQADIPASGKLHVSSWVKSATGKQMSGDFIYAFNLDQIKPQLRFINKGSILPYTDKVSVSFEAINLHTVDVEIFKIFSNNVLYNLHFNYSKYEDQYNMVRIGRVVAQKTIHLEELSSGGNESEWKRYAIDLSELVKAEPGAMYQLRLSFRPGYSNYACESEVPSLPENFFNEESGLVHQKSFWRDYAYFDYSDPNVNYGEDIENPCSVSYYYSKHFAKCSFYASNLAMAVKSTGSIGNCYVAVYDILDGSPVKDATIECYDPQLQLLGTSKSDGKGICMMELNAAPMLVKARHGDHFAYLKLEEGKSIAHTEFEIQGEKVQDGMKASLFTERGVWRPGDTIYFNALLFQLGKQLPPKLPVELSVKNPLQKIVYKTQISDHIDGLYCFKIPLRENDVTGHYQAILKVGLSTFQKSLLVETIKPNRIKVNWNLPEKVSANDFQKELRMEAKWLYGAPAAGLRTRISLSYSNVAPVFEKYAGYSFMDPEVVPLTGEDQLFDNELDPSGVFTMKGAKAVAKPQSGMLNARLVSYITDPSGDISTDYYPFKMDVFDEYVGIKIPENPYGGRSLQIGEEQEIKMLVIDKNGQPVAGRELQVDLYQVSYEWWYELRNSYRSSYENSTFKKQLLTRKIVSDQKGVATLKIKLDEYDRFYLKVRNLKNQYLTGDYFYTGWPYDPNGQEFVNLLSFKSDKKVYHSNDQARILLPGAMGGNYHVCLIKDNRILQTASVPAKKEGSEFVFKVASSMAPNLYVDVSYIQGIKDKKNDLPLRLYGVIPLTVEDIDKKLTPVITMPDVIKPDQPFQLEIREGSNRDMAYQVFIVDEGLLQLTRFKTPNPYDDLMAKEALALFTWDNFDEILTNPESNVEQVFSIGGDEVNRNAEGAKNKRFKPVVLSSGVFKVKAGKSQKHEFVIKNYIGAVRVMVIANNAQACGSVEKSVPVKADLMTYLTLPRTISYKDQIDVPVTIFYEKPGGGNVSLDLNVTGAVKLMESGVKTVQFKQAGEQTVYFKIQGTGSTGNGSVQIVARSGRDESKAEQSFFVDNPNPVTNKIQTNWIKPGEKFHAQIDPYGMPGTRKTTFEVSGLQGVSLKTFAEALIRYPHGCLEQTISSIFPQVYLPTLVDLTVTQRDEVNQNIQMGFEKLRRFQLPNGSFGYWPGSEDYSDWNTSYAGHFMVVAKNKGFYVPADLFTKWQNFQVSSAQSYLASTSNQIYQKHLLQAYRLYTLALSGKPNYAGMNALYQLKDRDGLTNVLLGAAYYIAGKRDLAEQLVRSVNSDIATYRDYERSYGSDIRDEAFIAQVLALMGNKGEASAIVNRLFKSSALSLDYTTQEMSFVCQAIADLYDGKLPGQLRFTLKLDGKQTDIAADKPYFIQEFDPNKKISFDFINTSNSGVSIKLIQLGKEDLPQSSLTQNGIKVECSMKPEFESSAGKIIPGDRLFADVKITNATFGGRMGNLALSLVFPSGFEIVNERISGDSGLAQGFDYIDFRDDRVLAYFGLDKGQSMHLRIPVLASYVGKYTSPVSSCEAMYDPNIHAYFKIPDFQIHAAK